MSVTEFRGRPLTFTEQCRDIIQLDESNQAHIFTHGVSGFEWGHYRNLLPEHV